MQEVGEVSTVCKSHITDEAEQWYRDRKPDEDVVRCILQGMVREDGTLKTSTFEPEWSDYIGIVVTTNSPQIARKWFKPENEAAVPQQGDTSDRVSLVAREGVEGGSGEWVNLMSAIQEDIDDLVRLLTRSKRVNRLIIITQKPFEQASSTLSNDFRPKNIPVLGYVDEELVEKYIPDRNQTLNKSMTSDSSYGEVEVLKRKDEHTTDELLQQVADNVGADIYVSDEELTLKDVAAELAVASDN